MNMTLIIMSNIHSIIVLNNFRKTNL